MSKARILWFTGLSGSGKSTIATLLKQKLEALGKKVSVLDGDDVRNTLHQHLGFSPEDIRLNNKLIGDLCEQRQAEVDFILVPVIAPFRDIRESARARFGDRFVEVYVKTNLETCIERDVKGLYKRALAGEIENFIGIADAVPYQAPIDPELSVETEGQTVEQSVEQIVRYLFAAEAESRPISK